MSEEKKKPHSVPDPNPVSCQPAPTAKEKDLAELMDEDFPDVDLVELMDEGFPDVDNSLPIEESQELIAIPVAGGSSGEGLPYAPINWPSPGDNWTWKVGNRSCKKGHWADRYLIPPSSVQKATGSKRGFASMLSLKEFIQEHYPSIAPNSFFSSFIWKIPCPDSTREDMENDHQTRQKKCRNRQPPEWSDAKKKSGSLTKSRIEDCKARNKMCCLQAKAWNDISTAKNCNICCIEADFCRDCCCILCCKSITYGGYDFIRCEANVGGNYVCGHVAHVDCALKCRLAGNGVNDSISLEVEYFCRRCDNKTDLIEYVLKLVRTCESLNSEDAVKRICTLSMHILGSSEKASAQNLRSQIANIMGKDRETG